MRCIAASIHPFWGGVPVILWSARQLFLTRLSYTGQPRRGQADGETVSYDRLMLAPQFQCSHPFAVIAVAKSPSDTQGSFKACAAVFSQGQLCQQLLNVGVGVLQLVWYTQFMSEQWNLQQLLVLGDPCKIAVEPTINDFLFSSYIFFLQRFCVCDFLSPPCVTVFLCLCIHQPCSVRVCVTCAG